MDYDKKFPNGFTSYLETHHEVVRVITLHVENGVNSKANDVMENRGTGGLYELAEDLTDRFEHLNVARAWDGEFFDEIEDYLNKTLIKKS